ncbi:hypothetical protein [Microcella sp.]|uniref:hypothetical protein n=1 Tax=Microcella sp. TaxID=1913979 RepID=UPI00391D7B59
MTITTHTPSPESTHARRPEAESIRPSSLRARRDRRSLTLIDRIALTVGVALVTWSRRPRIADRRDELERRVHRRMSDEQRERRQVQLMLQCLPPR